MLEFLAGFLTCAALFAAWHVACLYKHRLNSEQALVNHLFKVNHPAKHKAKSALGLTR